MFEFYIIILFSSTAGVLTTMVEYTIDQVGISLYNTVDVLIYYLRVLLATEFIRRSVFLGGYYEKTCVKNRDNSFEIRSQVKDDIELILEEVVSDKELRIEGKLSSIYTIKSKIISKILFNNEKIDYITSEPLENEKISSDSECPPLKDYTEDIRRINNYMRMNKDLAELYSKLKQFESEYELKICYRKLNELVYTT
ncbi:hypothetical protein MACK_000178 [Theileria orientalis]|uniref:Uncharacterized protein n=1 Tax=Theileria orientalis TaxID=68886 RepID=A0A976M9H1_THEOR|nr:hypothetical protein MACK_000178 [Theileria orientalis]